MTALSSLPGDWQSSLCLVDSNKYMLDNQIECDSTFILTDDGGDQVRRHAHKFMLISRSPVFFAMLSGPLAEKGQEIRVTDICPETFDQLLRYLYREDVELDDSNVFPLLYAAKKYMVTTLAKKCVIFLTSVLSPDNVCAFLDNGFLFEEDHELQKQCMELVSQHSRKVFHSEGFSTASRDTLCRLLRSETLTIHEVDVFRACVQWASRRCLEEELEPSGQNKRKMLGDAFRYIHFPTLSVNEFTKIVVPTGIMSTDEENVVFRYLLNGMSEQEEKLPFPTLSRECVECKCVATYDSFIKHTTSYTSLFHGMPQRSRWSFSLYTDHTIKLKEISFHGKFKGSVSVCQNGLRKMELSCNTHVGEIRLEEDAISLDAGLFTIATESPFSYLGEYYSKSVGNPTPGIDCDQDKVKVIVKESSTLCFLSHVIFIPTEEMHFVDDYYGVG